MGVYEGRAQIGKSLKDLQTRWTETKNEWHDSMSEQFEKTYLDPLEPATRDAVGAMDSMATLLSQIRRECQ